MVEEDGSHVAKSRSRGRRPKSLVLRANDAFLQPDGRAAGDRRVGDQGEDGRFAMEAIDPRTYGVRWLDTGGPACALLSPLHVTAVTGATRPKSATS